MRRASVRGMLMGLGLAGMLLPGAARAQLLFDENFDSIPQGARPSTDRFLVIGAIDDPFWYADGGGLNTGNLDDFPLGYSFAIVSDQGAKQWKNMRVSAEVEVLQREGTVALALRVKDSNNFYFAELKATPGADGSIQRGVEIYKMVGSIPRAIATGTQTIPAFESDGKRHLFEFEAEGSKLTVFLDRKQVLTANDVEFEAGAAGVGAAFSQVIFDNVKVSPLGAAAVAASSGGSSAQQKPGSWRVLIQRGMREQEARRNVATLTNYKDVAMVKMPDGTFNIYVGKYDTQERAISALEGYESGGLVVEGYEFVPDETQSAPSAGGPRFRVVVGAHSTIDDAQSQKAELESVLGVYPVDVVSESGAWKVIVGFALAEADAEKLAADLRAKNVTGASVVPLDSGGQAIDLVELERLAQNSAARVTDSERAQVLQLIRQMEEGRRGRSNLASQSEIAGKVGGLTDDQRRLLNELEDAREAQRTRTQRVKSIAGEVDAALANKNFDKALGLIDEWRKLEPNNVALEGRRRDIDNQKQLHRQKQAEDVDLAKRVDDLRTQAKGQEAGGKLAEALETWRQVLAMAPPSSALADEAQKNIVRVNLEIMKKPAEPAPAAGGGSNTTLIAAIVLGVLAILGGAAFMMSRKKAPPPPPAKPQPKVVVPPPTVAAAAPASKPSSSSGTIPKMPATAPAMPGPRADGPTAAVDRIRPGAYSPAPGEPGHVPAQAPSVSDAIALEGVVVEGLGVGTPTPIPTPLATEGPAQRQSGVVPLPTPITAPPDSRPPSSQAGPMKPPSSAMNMSSESLLTPVPDTAPNLFGSSAAVVPASASLPQGHFYAQDFAAEEIGKPPRNWKGTYDYATLVVAEGTPSAGVAKCLKFEKKTGSGSAYYSCRFPDASGRIIVEFDLRCDDKNKYLLGFYVEKDEDFRHSIHTVIHRDSQKVSLRLQNEPVPYNLGEWVHVKFHIDLTRAIVDGYMNDKPVAVGVKLASRPKVINTLSIRDNLATEGVLMIGNIQVYRER